MSSALGRSARRNRRTRHLVSVQRHALREQEKARGSHVLARTDIVDRGGHDIGVAVGPHASGDDQAAATGQQGVAGTDPRGLDDAVVVREQDGLVHGCPKADVERVAESSPRAWDHAGAEVGERFDDPRDPIVRARVDDEYLVGSRIAASE